ncbi:MAG TPA: hypothetical protein VL860_08785, partial [Planctomycetota bacterium]|nr:hypothetical protein [Planctomycetota bacterium]
MPNQVCRRILFAIFLTCLTCPAALPAADGPTSPQHLPADHTGEASAFLQTPAYKNLASWYAKKAPPLPAPKSPDDKVVDVATIDEFLAACQAPEPNTTIRLADGRYEIPDIVNIRHVKNLTIRSKSGDRAKVILDGAKSKNERILWVEDCDGCTVADLTIQNALKYGLCFEANTSTQKVRVYNVHFHNIWQRGLKITGLIDPTKRQWAICDTFDDRTRKLRPHDGRVEYCLFTVDHRKQFDDGVDNGDYIAGMDAMWLKDW